MNTMTNTTVSAEKRPREKETYNDSFTPEGAKRLEAKIRDWWERNYPKRAKNLKISLEPVGHVPVLRSARVDVRSNMIGAFPPAE